MSKDNKKEQLVCTECYNYYILVNGTCIYYIDYMYYKGYIDNIPNCAYQTYDIQKIKEFLISNGDISQENEENQNSNISYNKNFSTCRYCSYEYFMNDKGGCDHYTVENCSFSSILLNKNSSRYSNCDSMCSNTGKYASIEYYYELDVENDNNSYKLDINDLINSKINYTDSQDLISIINKGYLCLSNSGEGGKFSPLNLKKCKKAKYIISEDTYVCIECFYDYSLDNEANICKQSIQVNMNIHPGISKCQMINIGAYNNPIFLR